VNGDRGGEIGIWTHITAVALVASEISHGVVWGAGARPEE
jgi:hypothetical protein